MTPSSASNGGRANRTGSLLENFVENILRGCDYEACPAKQKADFFEQRIIIDGKHYIAQPVVGETIYGTKRKVDFFAINRPQFPEGLIIECKWQQAGGSVDEKYPFLVENIIHTGIPTIVVLDGGGYKPGAKKWLEGRVSDVPELVGVLDMAALQKETNNGFWG